MKRLSLALAWASVLVPASACLETQSIQAQGLQFQFRRGDSNVDGKLDISDATHTLGFLFIGSPPALPCEDASDSNDDGKVDISDAVSSLGFLFLGSDPPKEPYRDCGRDPTEDDLSCNEFPACPQVPEPPILNIVESPTQVLEVMVAGHVTRTTAAVEVSGPGDYKRLVPDAGGNFAGPFALRQNRLNRIYAISIDSTDQRSAPATIAVIQDLQTPVLHVDVPSDGSTVTNKIITVAGRVSDILSGFMGLTVTVRSMPIEVNIPQEDPRFIAQVIEGIGTNGTYERQGVPLQVGVNTVQVEGKDAAGNTRAIETMVTCIDIPDGSPHMEEVLGNGQRGSVFQEVPIPLQVQVSTGTGAPFADKIVTFHVVRSDGRLAATPAITASDGLMLLQVRTDQNGIAQCYWRLGGDAGCGNNRVEAISTGIAGTVLFCASAMAGPATKINIGSGNSQRGETGGQAAEPMRAWVNDGCNGVGSIPVTFTITEGDGKVNGNSVETVLTSSTGHAEATFTFGETPGNNTVLADFEDNSGAPASFTLFGLKRISNAPTSFTGLVLDNARSPIPGVKCFLEIPGKEAGIEVETNDKGRFDFQDIGASGLAFLTINAQDALCTMGLNGGFPCRYPRLTYDVSIVPNTDNSLPAPVIFPKLDPENIVWYDGSKDIELTVAGMEGLKMIVKAGSMTLPVGLGPPDNRKPTPDNPLAAPVIVSLNQVHHDQSPMPMPDGAAPLYAGTLEPIGAQFDPPIQIQYPNLSARPPGSIGYFMVFNHDTSRFEIVASGHVTDDGSRILSDDGAGLTLAGWHCNCPPYAVTASCRNCDPQPNGCTAWPDCWYIDIPGPGRPRKKVCFTDACNFHDVCWGTCWKNSGSSSQAAHKQNCNIEFITRLYAICDGEFEAGTRAWDCCRATAFVYLKGVSSPIACTFFYEPGQEAACSCSGGGPLSPELIGGIAGLPDPPFIDRDGDLLPDDWETEVGLDPTDQSDGSMDNDSDMLENHLEFINHTDPFNPDTDGNGMTDAEDLQSGQPPTPLVLDTSWTVVAAGQSVTVNPWGLFTIPNISAPDLFGIGGPGTFADSMSDDFIRVVGTSTVEGVNRYAFSDPFQITQDQTYQVTNFTVTDVPPPFPESIRITEGRRLLSVDQSTQLMVVATLGDGTEQNVTPRTSWTIYRTSNPVIAIVDKDGVVTAKAPGIAIITATNEGATSVARILVVEESNSTTVEGIVELEDGTRVEGARVATQFGDEAMTDANGGFTFLVRYPSGALLNISAKADVQEGYCAAARNILPVPNGTTDIGILVLRSCPGSSKENPAKSCLEILQLGAANGDGKYWIELPSDVFELYCDFTSDTGGWTRVGALDTSTGFCGNNSIADLRVSPDAAMGKVPDSDVQALLAGSPNSPIEVMYFLPSDGRYIWHVLENITDYDTGSRHFSSSFYCNEWHCDNGTIDASRCGGEGDGCPVTAHGSPFTTKKIYVDSSFSAHARGIHTNGGICGLPDYGRASLWIYVR